MHQIELFFPEIEASVSEYVVAGLIAEGYDSFWDDENGLRAYIQADKFEENVVKEMLQTFGLEGKVEFRFCRTTPGNWDRGNEDDFEPIIVLEKLRIRKSTLTPDDSFPYEIVVDPNLAFGSGSHPSTLLCIEMMLEVDFLGKLVADVGTGTGILAIVAEKLGAANVLAFDNNPWAVEVAHKNLIANNCRCVKAINGNIQDHLKKMKECEIILANLNMDVFRHEYMLIADSVAKGSQLMVSGIMEKDADELCRNFQDSGLTLKSEKKKEDWEAMLFCRE